METLKKWLDKLYPIGALISGGVSRLAYSDLEEKMHRALVDFAREEGLDSFQDYLGNTYIYNRQVTNEKAKAILIGSHLDSVPNGGRYDGVVGVLVGLRTLKELKDQNINLPIIVGAFRAEESSVFNQSVVGSSFAADNLDLDELGELIDKDGNRLKDILQQKGYTENKDFKIIDIIDEYLEVHIEQGRVLWDKKLDIGVVTNIAAPQRYKIQILGRQDHSGATPMNMRKDALVLASKLILKIEELGKSEMDKSSVATVGKLKLEPNSMNVVPGEVNMYVDVRGVNEASIDRIINGIEDYLDKICKENEMNYSMDFVSGGRPVKLSERIVDELFEITEHLGYKHVKMISGAGHDAMEFAEKVDTGMLFIPNYEGISHNPKEHTEVENLYNSYKILYQYLIKKEK